MGVSSDYHHGDLRRALLDQAADLIAAQGVQATSLREVARRAGVSHAAPAHHFRDKADLLASLAAEGHADLAERLGQAAGASDPWAALRAAGSAYLALARQRPGHFAVMTRCDLADPSRHPDLAQAAEASHAMLSAIILRLVPPAEAEALADAAWGVVHGLAALVAGGAMGCPEQAEARAGAALDRFIGQVQRRA